MFRTRIRKILGDVSARKGRTALVSIAIFIGVAGVIALSSLGNIVVEQLREDLKEDELYMLLVSLTVNADEQLDDDAYLETLRGVDGVTEVLGGAQAQAFFKLDESDERFTEGFMNSYTTPYEVGLPIEPLRLLDGGRYPQAGADEIAVEQRFADRYDLEVGDTLYFRVLSPSINPETLGQVGAVEPRTITGILFHTYTFNPSNTIYLPTVEEVNYLSGEAGLNFLLARFDDFETAQNQSEAFINTVANQTPYRVVFNQLEDPAQNSSIAAAQTIAGTMSLLAFIALVVSGFLVINVISSIIVEQKRQIGTMKSMGATRWDNFFMYAGIAFVYGLIGVIPGVLVGIPAGNAAAQALAPTLNTVLDGFRISPPAIITGVLIGLLVPVLAAIIPVLAGTRVKILDAMTDLGIDAKYGKGPIARFIAILPLPITIRQGLSNVSIKKSRLAFTVITLSIAAGAFMGIFAVFSSITGGIGLFIDIFNVEIGVIPNQGRDPQEIVRVLDENFRNGDNVIIDGIEPGFQFQVEFEGYEPALGAGGPPGIFAYGFDVESATPAFNVEVTEGDMLNAENGPTGIIFSSLLANNMGTTVGDTVIMKVPGNTVELTVVGISEFPLDQVWIDWRTLALATGYTTLPNVDSPETIPPEMTDFVQYATMIQTGNEELIALGLKPDVLRVFASLIGEGEMLTRNASEIIITREMADELGLSAGDSLPLASTQAIGTAQDYTVTGILDLPPQIAAAGIPNFFMAAYWEDLAALDGISLEGTPQPQAYFITTTLVNPIAAEVDPLMDEINDVMFDNGIPSTVINFVAQVDQITQAFVTIQVVLQLVAGLIAVVGALGLLTTLSMSVFERQKEIGVMRSIGASSSTVAGQFLTEGLVVGVISWLVGVPLALGIQMALLSTTGFDETFPATFPMDAAVIGLIGMLIITTIASLSPSLSAARKTVSDILRYQ